MMSMTCEPQYIDGNLDELLMKLHAKSKQARNESHALRNHCEALRAESRRQRERISSTMNRAHLSHR